MNMCNTKKRGKLLCVTNRVDDDDDDAAAALAALAASSTGFLNGVSKFFDI